MAEAWKMETVLAISIAIVAALVLGLGFNTATGFVAADRGLNILIFSNSNFEGTPLISHDNVNHIINKPASIIFSGHLQIESDDVYRFYVPADGSVKLSINDKVIIDDMIQSDYERSASVFLPFGSHKIRLDYSTNKGYVQLLYSSSSIGKQLIPKSKFRPV